MNAFLLIGDMHVKSDTIPECRAFMEWAASEAKRLGAILVLMGDQFDTHGNIRVDVLNFWTWVYNELLPKHGVLGSVSLIGNHDMDFAGQHTSMIPFSGVTKLVGQNIVPIDIAQGLYAVGYIKHSEKFLAEIAKLPPDAKIVLCHQEFDGAMYESGFYAPSGAKLDQTPAGLQFISGHIHLKQQIGNKVLYVGTPRQVGRADSDSDKSVWLLKPGSLESIRVPDAVVPRFLRLTLKEGDAIPEIVAPAKTFVDLYGSVEFMKKTMKALPEGVRVRTFPDRQSVATKSEFKESEGVGQALVKYVDQYVATNQDASPLKGQIVAKLKTLCPGLVD